MSDSGPRHPSAQRVDRFLSERGLVGRVRELSGSTRTAEDAAAAVGCSVAQIVKSLVFRAVPSGRPVLILASGAHRVDEGSMARFVGEAIARSDPEFARAATGFAIGGVPPVGLPTGIPTFVDYDLLEHSEVWAAAGHPHAVCRLSASELLGLTSARPVPVEPIPVPRDADHPWVTFDCYGTLVDWRTGLREAIRRVTVGASEEKLDALFAAYLEEEQLREAAAYRPYREIMAEAVRAAALRTGVSLSDADADSVPESIPDWPLFPETRETLSSLVADGYRVAVLSNVDRGTLLKTVGNRGLPVAVAVTAEDVRAYKPAPAHWVRFLKSTGADPGSVRHVAGEYPYDLPPAARLGFRTVLVMRTAGPPPGPHVDDVVRDLRGVGQLLRNVTHRSPGEPG